MARYGLTDEQLATLGLLVIEVGLVDFQVGAIHQMFYGDEGRGLAARLKSVRKAASATGDQCLVHFAAELSWGMSGAVLARDLVAHGIALTDDDGQNVTLFSPDRHSQMPVRQICDFLPRVEYARKCAAQMIWRMGGVEPGEPLPERPR